MERVTMTSHKCLAGTNILADQDQKEEVKPLTPRSKRMALVAKRLQKRKAKASKFSGLMHGVFEGEDNNQSVYDNSVKNCVDHVLNGGVGAVFTYGQTGSGKTHTILGYGEECGLAYRSINAMHEHLESLEK